MYNHKCQAEQEQQRGSDIYIFIIIFNATAATGCTALPPSGAELNIASASKSFPQCGRSCLQRTTVTKTDPVQNY